MIFVCSISIYISLFFSVYIISIYHYRFQFEVLLFVQLGEGGFHSMLNVIVFRYISFLFLFVCIFSAVDLYIRPKKIERNENIYKRHTLELQ